jgi:hypothetical protein
VARLRLRSRRDPRPGPVEVRPAAALARRADRGRPARSARARLPRQRELLPARRGPCCGARLARGARARARRERDPRQPGPPAGGGPRRRRRGRRSSRGNAPRRLVLARENGPPQAPGGPPAPESGLASACSRAQR